jgi:hypothetical protein
MAHEYAQVTRDEWVSFPGGELEGKRPKALCPACRNALKREAMASRRSGASGPADLSCPSSPSRPLCFQCYRADLDRERAIAAAGHLDTASEARFQFQLPLEPVNHARLDGLKAVRAGARTVSGQAIGAYVNKRRHAQIAARHALQAIAEELRARRIAVPERRQEMTDAVHAAELQLPEAWLAFVVSR